jgi:spore coat polysaccharide biosynthesis protein SpsF
MGSSRLPGKVLADLAGQPMLAFMLERLRPLGDHGDLKIVVATSTAAADDPVAAVAQAAGVAIVRGSEHDVLARFQAVLAEHPADDVVRLTGDCPLVDPQIVVDVLAHHRQAEADYTSNTLVRTFPDGLDAEVIARSALEAAGAEARDPVEREHVTPFIYRRPSRFRLAQHTVEDLAGDERWTVDTNDDLDWVRSIVDQLVDPVTAGWRTILAVAGRRARDDKLRLLPVPLPDNVQTMQFVRRWRAVASGVAVGEAEVIVNDGVGTLKVEGPHDQRSAIVASVRRALVADLQVRELLDAAR